jgi:hypothetical protein
VGRVGKIGPHRVGAERQADLASDASHRLGGIERRAQRPAHRQQRLHLAQPQLLAPQQLRPFDLCPLAAGDVAQDRQMTTRHEPRRRPVLHVPDLAIGPDQPYLARLLA